MDIASILFAVRVHFCRLSIFPRIYVCVFIAVGGFFLLYCVCGKKSNNSPRHSNIYRINERYLKFVHHMNLFLINFNYQIEYSRMRCQTNKNSRQIQNQNNQKRRQCVKWCQTNSEYFPRNVVKYTYARCAYIWFSIYEL